MLASKYSDKVMTQLTRLFPLLALLAAIVAWLAPQWFAPLGSAITPLLTLIMFAMGLTLTLDNFRNLRNRPVPLLVGTALQFLLMPLLAFALAVSLQLSPEMTTGLILVGCCPGGTASNVVCYLARGDVALSISLTMLSTLLSVFATPLLTWFYLGQAIDVPIAGMMQSIVQIVLLPVVAGLLLNTWAGSTFSRLAPVLPVISVLAIVLIIAIVVALNAANFLQVSVAIVAAVILHNLAGYGSAYGICRWLRFDERICRTIAIEVGMQNSGLAVALASQFYSAAAALPGAIFSLWHNLSGALLAGLWNSRRDKI